jgi:Ger(x)C family germination protein
VLFLAVFPVLVLIGAGLRKWINTRKRGNAGGAKLFFITLLLAAPLVSLTGCHDRVEIENRAFAVAIGIDKAEKDEEAGEDGSRYTMTVSVPSSGGDDEGENDEKHIKKATAETLTEAMRQLNAKDNKRLYYGQAKIIVLGDGLLEDAAMVRNAVETLANHPEIDRQIHVLAVYGNALEALEVTPPGETMPGLYVAERYRDKQKANDADFSLDLEALSACLSRNGCALVPAIQKDGDELRPNGAVVLMEYKKAETLSPEELRGFLWCLADGNRGEVVTAWDPNKKERAPIPFTVERHAVKIRFEPAYPTLRAVVEVRVEGNVTENPGVSAETVKLLIANEIAGEITKTAAKLGEKNLDAYHWKDLLRKKQYSLYRRYGCRWPDIYPALEIAPRVSVRIKPN